MILDLNLCDYSSFFGQYIYGWKDNDSSYFYYPLMNISPHLFIDAVILSTALSITLVLRAKGNATRKEKGNRWLLKKKKENLKNLSYIKFGTFLFMEVLLLLEFS